MFSNDVSFAFDLFKGETAFKPVTLAHPRERGVQQQLDARAGKQPPESRPARLGRRRHFRAEHLRHRRGPRRRGKRESAVRKSRAVHVERESRHGVQLPLLAAPAAGKCAGARADQWHDDHRHDRHDEQHGHRRRKQRLQREPLHHAVQGPLCAAGGVRRDPRPRHVGQLRLRSHRASATSRSSRISAASSFPTRTSARASSARATTTGRNTTSRISTCARRTPTRA